MSGAIDAAELRIVMIGKTGTGKSATGNTILGNDEFESDISGSSITKQCQLGRITRFNRKISIVDTPGLYDTGMTTEQITQEISKCITMIAPGPHAIILTVNVGRFTEEENKTVKHFVNHFGEGMYNYLIVVFTKADVFESKKTKYKNISDYVRNCPESLKEILELCHNRYIPFNNELSDSRQELQVNDLIGRVDEIVYKNNGCCYTNEMFEEAKKALQRREDEVKRKADEDEQRKVQHLQDEFDKKITLVNGEKEKLTDEMKKIESEKQKVESRAAETRDQINVLKNELKDCKENEKNRNKEQEEKLGRKIHDLERQQAELLEQTKKANESRDAQLQSQRESEQRLVQKIEEMNKEHSRTLQAALARPIIMPGGGGGGGGGGSRCSLM